MPRRSRAPYQPHDVIDNFLRWGFWIAGTVAVFPFLVIGAIIAFGEWIGRELRAR